MLVHSQLVNSLGTPTEATRFRQAQAGDRAALNELMAEHDGLVHAVVRRQALGNLSYAEALHAGRIGLWRALLGYDPQRGVAFSTYAWTCIKRRVWQAVKRANLSSPPPAVETDPPTVWESDPAVVWEATTVRCALHDLVDRLPARLRYILPDLHLDAVAGDAAFGYDIVLHCSSPPARAREPFQPACGQAQDVKVQLETKGPSPLATTNKALSGGCRSP
ncbi:MAG TPA: sigma-70 family RNA polymerase sigma factor [Anaerolineae bacterium]|nr:sigma-70 family RNA polymerase sigma factor [Anaerolineae bacterium]